MALDGIAISCIVSELDQRVIGGKIDKIYQPERDELIVNLRSKNENRKLLLTASPSHPRVHLYSGAQKGNPNTAPLFCMVLRKHLSGGKIIALNQPGFERIIQIEIEAYNELGDLTVKKLIVEIMGKHSNIMLVDANGTIIDSIKHISHETSSVREVLPGKPYIYPPSKEKLNPALIKTKDWETALTRAYEGRSGRIQDIIYQSFTGISPIMASEICNRSDVWPDTQCDILTPKQRNDLFTAFEALMSDIRDNKYINTVYFDKNSKPIDFSVVELGIYSGYTAERFESISELLEFYYSKKDKIYRANQKTADLKKLIQANIERCVKKKEIHERTAKETAGRERHRIAGELITANIYMLEKGMTSFSAQNYNEPDSPEITIALDANLTPSENAQKYYKKYNKEKRAAAALVEQEAANAEELNYLEGLLNSIWSCESEEDIDELREELAEQGYIKKRRLVRGKKNSAKKTKPLHFVSADGFDMYVGKNNKQNDELTLKMADSHDMWFHIKDMPGSHVIVKTNGQEPPSQTLSEAANLAAYYSKARNGSNVPIDYTLKKNVKKPSGAKPGMVIYDNYRTAYITPIEPEKPK